jgi:hypothetical protein
MEEISLEELKEMEENLFQKQCDLDMQKAFVKYFIKKKELEQSSITAVGCPKGLQLKPLSEDMAKALEELSQSKVGNKPNKNRF